MGFLHNQRLLKDPPDTSGTCLCMHVLDAWRPLRDFSHEDSCLASGYMETSLRRLLVCAYVDECLLSRPSEGPLRNPTMPVKAGHSRVIERIDFSLAQGEPISCLVGLRRMKHNNHWRVWRLKKGSAPSFATKGKAIAAGRRSFSVCPLTPAPYRAYAKGWLSKLWSLFGYPKY